MKCPEAITEAKGEDTTSETDCMVTGVVDRGSGGVAGIEIQHCLARIAWLK